MRYTVLLLFILAGMSNSAFSQRIKVAAGYNHTYLPQWDKAIQTYNFSRPFLQEPQPVLAYGSYLEFQLLFGPWKKWQSGIKIDHSYMRSRADNIPLSVTLHANFLQLGYVLQHRKMEEGFVYTWELSAVSGVLTRKVNGEPYRIDDSRATAFGIGGKTGLTVGYERKFGTVILIPFVGIGYSPYFWSPNSEAILNQTRELSGEAASSIFDGKIGIRFSLAHKHVATRGNPN